MDRADLHSCLPCNECQVLWSREHGYQRWQALAMNNHPPIESRQEAATLGDNSMDSFLLNVSAHKVEELKQQTQFTLLP